MRKRNVVFLLDNLFWLVMALLPLILHSVNILCYRLSDVTQVPSSLFTLLNSALFSDSIVYSSLAELFGPDGILPLFTDSSIYLRYMAYFVSVEIVHLAVDFLVFIPKLCHKWLGMLTSTN